MGSQKVHGRWVGLDSRVNAPLYSKVFFVDSEIWASIPEGRFCQQEFASVSYSWYWVLPRTWLVLFRFQLTLVRSTPPVLQFNAENLVPGRRMQHTAETALRQEMDIVHQLVENFVLPVKKVGPFSCVCDFGELVAYSVKLIHGFSSFCLFHVSNAILRSFYFSHLLERAFTTITARSLWNFKLNTSVSWSQCGFD